ncbi:MAG: ATP-binding cassette domain-containing protein [Polyangiales bacterium]
MSVLETIALGKSFGDRPIFEDVSLQLARGEALALMGPSGAGKTTFLRCLNGLERADRGDVVVGDIRITERMRPAEHALAVRLVRAHVGFVFQGSHLFSHRSVLDNVLEGPIHVRRQPRAQCLPRALSLLEKVGILHRQNALPRQLSYGEQQRAAIARALAMDPEVLLLDEPTSALDGERTARLSELLRSLLAEGVSLLTVTHDARFADALGARIHRLEHGRITPT